MGVVVEVALCMLAGVAASCLAVLYDRVRARRRPSSGIALEAEPFVEDAWHCPMCHFLAMLKRSDYGREWRANILAAIDRGAPAHGPLDFVMREAPPLSPRLGVVPGRPERDGRAARGQPR